MTRFECNRCSSIQGQTVLCVLEVTDSCYSDLEPMPHPTSCPYEGAAFWAEVKEKVVAKDQAGLFL
jgi:hypothetical protein